MVTISTMIRLGPSRPLPWSGSISSRNSAYWDDEQDFPELDGPVFLIGACALVDAIWAAVGEDPLAGNALENLVAVGAVPPASSRQA